MKAPAYTPREGSVAWKVIEFLTTNPDDTLTAQDASIKFDCCAKAVHSSLSPAVQAGVLRRDEDGESGELVYRLGRGAPAIKPRPGAHPTLKQAALAQPGAALAAALLGAPARGYLDTAAVQIDKGVPVAPKCGGRQTDWAGLLQRMEPGDSCALPLRVRSSLAKVIHVEHEARPGRYQVRKVDGETLRLWRTA